MAMAYLRVWVFSGKEAAVQAALRKVKGVKSAHLTAGDQDVMVLLEGKSYEDILCTVLQRVRGIEGIRGTATNLVLE